MTRRRVWLWVFAAVLVAGSAAAAEPVVRVGVLSLLKPGSLELRPLDPGRMVLEPKGEAYPVGPDGFCRLDRLDGHLALRIDPSGAGARAKKLRWIPAAAGGRWEVRLPAGFRRIFAGPACFTPERAGPWIRAVVDRPLESYVAGVVQAEQARLDSPPALAALAVLARGNAVAWRGRHRRDGFDLCDNTHCMLYLGEEAVADPVRAAVRESAGKILTVGGHPSPHPFTACCGGHLFPSGWLWPDGSIEGLRECPWCRESPDFRWRYQAPREIFLDEVARALDLRAVQAVSIVMDPKRGPRVTVTAAGKRSDWPVEQFRIRYGRLYGWNRIRSNNFNLERQGGQFVLEGKGFGHCAGLCLAGAIQLGLGGRSVEEILRFYFPESRVANLASINSSKPSW